MNRTLCRFKHVHYVVSRLFCVSVLGLSTHCFGQPALPPLHPVNVLNFTIPFEVSESASALGDIELLVSKDKGRRWHSAARQPVETGKFAFRAEGEGEYWFAFRRNSAAGSAAPFNGHPHLRVLVNTGESIIVPPAPSMDSGPITPPKPERFRPETMTRQPPPPSMQQLTQAEKGESEKGESGEPTTRKREAGEMPSRKRDTDERGRLLEPERTIAEESRQAFGPRLPGFDPSAARRNHEERLLEDLLSGMSPFMDVHPVTVSRAIPNNPVSAPVSPNAASTLPRLATGIPAGGITGVDLHESEARPKTHVIVQWNPGNDLWRDAQIDVLRSNNQGGPWVPIAINLPNNGEYWWFLTPEDLKPFYVAVRIRSLHGGIQMNVTQSAIEIESKMAQFQR